MNIHFFPIPYRQIQRTFRSFLTRFRSLLGLFPNLGPDLEQSEIDVRPEIYLMGALFSATVMFLLIISITLLITAIAKPAMLTPDNILVIAIAGGILWAFGFSYAMLFPGWKAQQRAVTLEKDLLFAIRHLTVQTNAGVPLFAAMVSVSEERGQLGYGAVSKEFGRIIKEVEGGSELSDALEASASRIRSRYYDRIMWQLANANRAGVPVNEALRALLDYLSEEQKIALRKYGAQLSPLALMYLLVTIVGPTLGLIFLMIASTLIALPLSDIILNVLLVMIIVVQIFFLGLIQSRRPTVAL